MEKPRSITLESQKPEEALQPLAAALLESAEWQQLNNTEEMTAEAPKSWRAPRLPGRGIGTILTRVW